MALVKMSRVEIYGRNCDRKKILEYLHKEEIMEFSEAGEDLDKKDTARYISRFNSYLASAAQAVEIMSEYEKSGGLFKKRPSVDTDLYEIDTDEVNEADKYVRRVIKNQRSIEANKESIGKILAKKESLKPYISLDVPMQLSSTETTFVKTGVLEGEWSMERILTAFSAEDTEDVYVEIINAEKAKTYLWLAYPKAREDAVQTVFRKIGFSTPNFSLSHHTPQKKLEVLDEAMRMLEAENEGYRHDIEICAEKLGDIKLFYDRLMLRREKYEALSKVGLTKNTFVMAGYIPKNRVDKLKAELESKYMVYITVSEPEEGEEAPSAFSNNPIAEAVEGITSDYSMPSAQDIDPNPIMAWFYYFFFGMMFSDAGYGLILMIVCGILGFGKMLEKKSRKMFKMFFYCGVFTTFWGIMYGSFFGDMIATVSNTFGKGELSFSPILMDPTKKPLELLIMSVAFGMIHILTAMCIKFYMTWRDGQRLDAVFDTGFWIAVLLGISLWAAGFGLSAAILSNAGMVLAAVGAVGLVLTGGRKNKNIFSKLFGGILSLYDITSYVGDVLSYSRLMALGLATGVIASVINILGSLGGKSVLGLIAYIVISIFGHTLNFAINMLGAYVHTNRLQYVEFYQKFYEGGGRMFSPLSLKTKYYNFSKDK